MKNVNESSSNQMMLKVDIFFLILLKKKMSNILLKNNNPFSHNGVFTTPYKCNNYSEHNEISYLY